MPSWRPSAASSGLPMVRSATAQSRSRCRRKSDGERVRVAVDVGPQELVVGQLRLGRSVHAATTGSTIPSSAVPGTAGGTSPPCNARVCHSAGSGREYLARRACPAPPRVRSWCWPRGRVATASAATTAGDSPDDPSESSGTATRDSPPGGASTRRPCPAHAHAYLDLDDTRRPPDEARRARSLTYPLTRFTTTTLRTAARTPCSWLVAASSWTTRQQPHPASTVNSPRPPRCHPDRLHAANATRGRRRQSRLDAPRLGPRRTHSPAG